MSASEIKAAKALKTALLDIADDLDELHGDADVARFLGRTAAVVGTVVAAAVTIGTGGLAAPALAGGAAAIAGTATAVGADIVEAVVSNSKLRRAQSELDHFRNICLHISAAHKTATAVATGASSLREVIKNPQAVKVLGGVHSAAEGAAKNIGKIVPVASAIFVALDVVDIIRIILSDNKSEAARNLRNLVHNVLDKIIYN